MKKGAVDFCQATGCVCVVQWSSISSLARKLERRDLSVGGGPYLPHTCGGYFLSHAMNTGVGETLEGLIGKGEGM